jgi:dinuclear metal center YbgI/SA1388 family protein
MTIRALITYLENKYPKGVAWENDNVGLQLGNLQSKLKNVFLTLDIDMQGLERAVSNNCNLIITHHPLLFSPLKNLNLESDARAQIIEKCIKKNITIYSAHTNFDFAVNGVSFSLAEKLGLTNINFLENTIGDQYKLCVFVPELFLDRVAEAIFEAGGGRIGNYNKCSYRVSGTGTFEGNEQSNPLLGISENFEQVEEVKLEVILDKWNLNRVVSEMISAHPYEEPAYDIYPLENDNVNFGFGAIGDLKTPMTEKEFLAAVSKSLRAENLRYCSGTGRKIKKVAVCGGSGVRHLKAALKKGADAYVTADIKYHDFQAAEKQILFIDAGHYETEVHAMNELKKQLSAFINLKGGKNGIIINSGSTNPVKFYNN